MSVPPASSPVPTPTTCPPWPNALPTHPKLSEPTVPSQLEQLRQYTTVVADTGDIEAIARWRPVDATTNPSLLLKVVTQSSFAPLLEESLAWARARSHSREQQLVDASDHLAVAVGRKILELIPGRVSTEVDARLSFDTDASIAKAERLIGLYED